MSVPLLPKVSTRTSEVAGAGTTVGLPFGPYHYTDGLGVKLFGHTEAAEVFDDQADFLEPVEQLCGNLRRDPLAGQLGGQLGPAPGAAGELVEQDLAGHRLLIGLRAGLDGVLGRWLRRTPGPGLDAGVHIAPPVSPGRLRSH